MKAILVIDMPKFCEDKCPCTDYCVCYPMGDRRLEDDSAHKRPSWCPLKPMPQKMEESWMEFPADCDYRLGWNDCIKEIENEQNDKGIQEKEEE